MNRQIVNKKLKEEFECLLNEIKEDLNKYPYTTDFIIHDHYASHHHFDLRIKYKDKLRSWALPKARIPKTTGDKILAVRVPDHDLNWLEFEGTIPKEEYGGGTVYIYEKGTCTIYRWSDTMIIVEFNGNKVNGFYSIVKTPRANDNFLIVRMDQIKANKTYKQKTEDTLAECIPVKYFKKSLKENYVYITDHINNIPDDMIYSDVKIYNKNYATWKPVLSDIKESEINQLEEMFDIVLPKEFKEMISKYFFKNMHIKEGYLYSVDSRKRLNHFIESNLKLRELYNDTKFFIIGEGDSKYICIDCNDIDYAVYKVNPENLNEYEIAYQTFNDFIKSF